MDIPVYRPTDKTINQRIENLTARIFKHGEEINKAKASINEKQESIDAANKLIHELLIDDAIKNGWRPFKLKFSSSYGKNGLEISIAFKANLDLSIIDSEKQYIFTKIVNLRSIFETQTISPLYERAINDNLKGLLKWFCKLSKSDYAIIDIEEE